MGSKSQNRELPLDVMFEILTRTPSLKAIDACKSMCKPWNNMIYESSFMPNYCKRTNNTYGYFLQDLKYGEFRTMFVSYDHQEGGENIGPEALPRKIEILASCNQGLLCSHNYRHYVCKPMTRQWQALPNPKMRFQQLAMAMMVVPYGEGITSPKDLRYKIIRLSRRGFLEPALKYIKHRCEIFDSKFWTWYELERDVLLPDHEHILPFDTAISSSSAVHWLTTNDNVLMFCFITNTFHKFRLPEPTTNNRYNRKEIFEYEGKLGLTYEKQVDHVELWILEDRKTGRWTKRMVFSLENLLSVVNYPTTAGFYNSDIAFIRTSHEVFFYHLQDGSYKRVKLEDLNEARQVFLFRSDSEPVNLCGRPRFDIVPSCFMVLLVLFLMIAFFSWVERLIGY